jgi:hypothetical protein
VDGPTISLLIRSTMVALHQANVTGNYTVLRDLGAEILRRSNTAADLSELFAQFRKTHMSLASTVLNDAVMDKPPALTTDGQLELVGHFMTTPQELIFDLTFLFENGDWRIAVIKVGTREPAGGKPSAGKADAKPKAAAEVPLPRERPKP